MVRDKRFYIHFFTLLIPIMIQNIVSFSVNLADNVMIGGYSETALSGIALANQVQFMLQMLVMGVCEGLIVISSQYWGKGEPNKIKQIVSVGVKAELILALVFFVIAFNFPEKIIGLMIQDPFVIAEGAAYLKIISFTYFFFCMSNILISSMRSVENVRIALLVTICALVVNVFFNYCFIYGNLGFPEWGAKGAAVATLIGRVVEFAVIFVYVLKFDQKLKLNLKDLFGLDFEFLKDYIQYGAPVITSNFIWALGSAFQAGILGRMGSEIVASSNIANTIFQIMTVGLYASASASSIIIGKTVGEGAIKKVKDYTKTLQFLFLMLGLVTSLALFGVKDLILQVYNISAGTKELARQFILVLCVTAFGTAYQMPALTGIVRGGGDTKFVLYNDMIFVWLVVLPLSYLAAFVFHLPPMVVFMFLKCDQILKCFVALVKVNRYKWVKSLTR